MHRRKLRNPALKFIENQKIQKIAIFDFGSFLIFNKKHHL